MTSRDWMSDDLHNKIFDEERVGVLEAMEKAEGKGAPPLSSMFEDVYYEKTKNLLEQEEKLLAHVHKYPEFYSGGH